MSIISEALKKAEKESVKKQNFQPTVFPKPNPWIWFPSIVALLIIIISLFLASNVRNTIRHAIRQMSETKNREEVALKSSPSIQERKGVTTKSALQSKPSPSHHGRNLSLNTDNLYLSGIMYSTNKPLAVINDEIIHEGSLIRDVKIVKINPKSVELERNGLRAVLRLRR